MSVKRRDVIRYLEKNGYLFQREGRNHSIYCDADGRCVPVGRHNTFERREANRVCKEAGIPQIF